MVYQKTIYIGKKPNISNKFYPTKTPVTAVMIIKIEKSKIPKLITQNTEIMISISFANRIKKNWSTNNIKNGEKTIQYITIESKYGFLKSTSFKLKIIQKMIILGQQWKKISTHK